MALFPVFVAEVAKLADAPDLGSGPVRGMSSNLFLGKHFKINELQKQAKLCIDTRSHRVSEFVARIRAIPENQAADQRLWPAMRRHSGS
jgi:hypothetical protein